MNLSLYVMVVEILSHCPQLLLIHYLLYTTI